MTFLPLDVTLLESSFCNQNTSSDHLCDIARGKNGEHINLQRKLGDKKMRERESVCECECVCVCVCVCVCLYTCVRLHAEREKEHPVIIKIISIV